MPLLSFRYSQQSTVKTYASILSTQETIAYHHLIAYNYLPMSMIWEDGETYSYTSHMPQQAVHMYDWVILL